MSVKFIDGINVDGTVVVDGVALGTNAFTSTTIATNNNQLINGAGYITSASLPTVSNATVTVNTGTGLDGGTTFTLNQSASKTISLSLDLNELGAGGTLVGTDSLVSVNGGASNKQLISSIPLSIFNNNSGWTSNTGTTTASNAQTFTSKSGNISQWTNNSGYITSYVNTTYTAGTGLLLTGTVFSNTITNNSQLTNGAGYTTNTGTTTPSNTQTFTNKSGNVSQWTNDAGYITSAGDITGVTAGTLLDGGGTSGTVTLNVDLSELAQSTTSSDTYNFVGISALGAQNKVRNTSINAGSFVNNLGWTTNTGTTTPSNTQTFTNKSGNISQWTNDSGYKTTDNNTTYSAGSGITLTGTVFSNASPNIVQTTVSGNAGSATVLQTARTIAGVSFNGSANISLNNNAITNGAGYITSYVNTTYTAGTGLLLTGTVFSNTITNNNQLTNGAGYTTNTGTVTQVGISHGGNAFNVSLPVTTSGTLAVTMAGSSAQYVNGLGNLTTFPSIPQGDITGVTAGTLLTGGGTSGAVTLNADLNLLATSTTASDAYFFAGISALGAQNKVRNTSINAGSFNNNLGWTTNTGTTTPSNTQTFTNKSGNISQWTNNSGYVTSSGVTSVGATAPITSSGGTSPTIGVTTAAVSAGSSSLATGAQIQTAINTATTGVLTYKGTWNASTNSPTLTSGSGTTGNYYIVSTAGSTNLDGITDWALGDWAVFSDQATDAWQKIDNSSVGSVTGTGVNNRLAIWNGTGAIDSNSSIYTSGTNIYAGGGNSSQWNANTSNTGTVTSVSQTHGGNAFTVGGSPVTSSGTLAVTMAGTSAQYVNGAGNLTTFPSIPQGDITAVVAGTGMSGGGTSGSVTLTNSSPNIVQTTVSGNAGSATVLQTARTIAGVSFNGSANISLNNNAITNGAGYITSGSLPTVSNATVTVTTGTGLDGATSFTLNQSANKTIALTLDLNELGAGAALVGTDSLVAVNGTVSNKQLISSIPLSIFSNNAGWTSNTGDITGVTAGSGLSGGGTSGTVTITNSAPNIVQTTVSGNAGTATTLQTARTIAGVSFNGSANISLNNNAITNGAGYTSNSGDITGVTAGTLLTGGGTSGTVTLNTDLSLLTQSTTSSDTYNFVGISALGAQNKVRNNSIDAGSFNNNLGWTSNVGDITGVTAGTGMSGGGTSGTVTLNCTITNNNQLTNGAGYTSNTGTTTPSNTQTFTNKSGNISQWTNNSGYTTNAGDITGVTAGSYLTGGGTSGSVTLNVNAATASTVSTVVARDSSGDINARLFKSEYDTTNASIGYVMTQVDTVTNNYMRPSTMAQLRSSLNVANGATNVTNNNQLTNGSGYVTSSGNTIIGTDTDVNTSGSTIIDNIYMTDGVITSHGTRVLTLANLGYTGATNANYITNNNQLTNGAGYITSYVNTTYSAGSGLSLTGTVFANTSPNIVQTTVSGNAGTVTNGVYTTGTQTIGGAKTFTSAVKVTSGGATLDFGSLNATWCHFNTTATSGFYFYDGISISGGTLLTSASVTSGTFNGALNGNATTATRLQTARTIAGVSFNGTANISLNNNAISNGAGYTTNVGDITGVTAGTGMSGGGTSGTVTLNCTINTPGEVGLGNLSSSGNALSGSFTATGNITAYSDERLKENIETIPNALEKVNALRGVTFDKDGERGLGVIAQEVEKILPEVVQDNEEYKSVAYGNIVGVLIEAIKEQDLKIQRLEGLVELMLKSK